MGAALLVLFACARVMTQPDEEAYHRTAAVEGARDLLGSDNCDTCHGHQPAPRHHSDCESCHDTITEDRRSRFAERQRQIELSGARGESHLGGGGVLRLQDD